MNANLDVIKPKPHKFSHRYNPMEKLPRDEKTSQDATQSRKDLGPHSRVVLCASCCPVPLEQSQPKQLKKRWAASSGALLELEGLGGEEAFSASVNVLSSIGASFI